MPDRALGDEAGMPRFNLSDADLDALQREDLNRRIKATESWLHQNAAFCFDEQVHLDEGTRERAYWHHGYLLALRDVRDYVMARKGR